MNLKELQRHWIRFGQRDPFWAILSLPDKKGGKWAPDDFFQTGKDDILRFFEYLGGLGARIPKRHALDFGCGVGRLTQALAEIVEEASGVDISPSMIRLARQYNRFGDRCRYYLNERDDLSIFGDDSFDLVFSLITLQHIPPRFVRRYLVEFMRVLAPGGILYFQLPSRYLGPPQVLPGSGKDERMGVGEQLRKVIKRVTPQSVQGLYRTARDWNQEPVMEMYGIERLEVERLLEDHGAIILNVVDTQHTTSIWESLCYCVTRT